MQVKKQAKKDVWREGTLPAMIESGGMQVIKQARREV